MTMFRVQLRQGGEAFNLDLTRDQISRVERQMRKRKGIVTDSRHVSVAVSEIAALVPLEPVCSSRFEGPRLSVIAEAHPVKRRRGAR